MDFIKHLPVSEDCSTVWVIVDRYTKMAYFIPIENVQKTAEGCAKLVWQMFGNYMVTQAILFRTEIRYSYQHFGPS